MTDKRRHLMLLVADGNNETLPILWHFDRLTLCDHVLQWCVSNRVTGQSFLEFYKEQNSSILNMASEIIRRVKRNEEKAPIFVGKDWRE